MAGTDRPDGGAVRARPEVDLTDRFHDPVPPGREPTLGELLSETTKDLSDLFRAEVDLAKLELKQEATTAAKAGGMLGAAGVLAHLALLLATFAAAWGLATVMPAGVAFLIVAVVVAIVAAVLFVAGRNRMREATPVAPQTVETLQEDARWARQLRN